MISIVVCSRSNVLFGKLEESIKKTIAAEYELISIDNASHSYSIFEAYNLGVEKAKGDILCFCHEDILFRTNNWGSTITNIFKNDNNIGLIGFASAHFLPDTPMYWAASPFISEYNLTNDNGNIIECYNTSYYNSKNIAEVVAVDGFCFFIKKSLFGQISFDEKTYKGFHMYDMDICMQVIKAGYKVCVTKDVLIEHAWSEKSMANKPGMELFEKNLSIFCSKWQSMLPINRGIDNIPDSVIFRINNLCKNAYEAKRVRKSKTYRIGKIILAPFKAIKRNYYDS